VGKFDRLRQGWLRPFFYFGINPMTLIGSGLTTAAAITLVFHWIANLMTGRFENPYPGLIFFLGLPGLFVLGLILIPIGITVQSGTKSGTRFAPKLVLRLRS
jgi:hypothetical protein